MTVRLYFLYLIYLFFFFSNDTATTEIYTLSLHDALPIGGKPAENEIGIRHRRLLTAEAVAGGARRRRSEEHTSELQSQPNLVCRLLLEKKKKQQIPCECNNSKSQQIDSTEI